MLYRYAHTTMRGALALLATGAIADQTTRWFSTSPTLLLVVWAALLIGLWVLTTRPSVEGSFAQTSLSRSASSIALTVGVVTAGTAFVLNSSHNQAMNSLAVAVALLLIIGSIAALRTAHHAEQASIGRYHHWWKKRDSAVLGACMAFVAAASDMTYRAITDDHYYVNLSTYIYDRGIIPTRDTVLSDQVFRGAPRLSSWEVLWGTLARLVHVPPAYLLYLVFIPLAAALSVVALAHLIDTAGITRYKEALVAGSIFIVFDGASAFSFGAYQGPRIWEGKSFLLAVIVPLVFSYAIRLVRNPTPRTRIDKIGRAHV